MPAVKGGPYAGVSATARQAERRRRLLDAGLEVLGSEGLAGSTVRGLCQQASLSPRFFYESFANVEELAVVLVDEIFQAATTAVVGAVAEYPPGSSERNRVAIETFVRKLTDDPRVARFTLMEAMGSDALRRRRLAMVRSAADALVQSKLSLGTARRSETYRQVAAFVLVGGLIELLIAWMHNEIPGELDQLVDDFIQLSDDVANVTHGTANRHRAAQR